MDKTEIVFGTDAFDKILTGMRKVYEPVIDSIGPEGLNTVIERKNKMPLVTNDGVTIARSIRLSDPIEAIGADLITQPALRTNHEVGDGTSTTIALAYNLILEGRKRIDGGESPYDIAHEFEINCEEFQQNIVQIAKPVEKEEVFSVAYTSCRDEEMSSMISDIFNTLGKQAVVSVVEGGLSSSIKISEGLALEDGMLNPFFSVDLAARRSELDDCLVITCQYDLRTPQQIIEILTHAVEYKKPIILFAPEYSEPVINLMLENFQRGKVVICPIYIEGTREEKMKRLMDIEILGDASPLAQTVGCKMFFAKKGIVTAKQTILRLNGQLGANAEAEKKNIENAIELTQSQLEKERLNRRLALYGCGYAELSIGGSTQAEVEYMKLRAEDAVLAVKAAFRLGIVPGAGEMLKELGKNKAFGVVYNAIQSHISIPTYEVRDPAAVLIHAVRNAYSIAKTAITINSIVYNDNRPANSCASKR